MGERTGSRGHAIDPSWPRNVFETRRHDYTVDLLLHLRERNARIYGDRPLLMGHVIPPFQRSRVWSASQETRFVESVFMGLPTGSWMYNDGEDGATTADGRPHETDRWLLDGQQRFAAIESFVDDGFPIFGRRFSEFSQGDARRFLNTPFPAFSVRHTDEAVLREIYDRMNFGGTPHRIDQRAAASGVMAVPAADAEDEEAPTFRR